MKVLLTGATGYIGRRLTQRLLEDKDAELRLFVRDSRKVTTDTSVGAEVVEGDTFNMESLREAVKGVDVAYYLIHSMEAGRGYEKLDRLSAQNFLDACTEAGVRRIIYLGGLGVKETASRHLLSRIEVGEVLSSRPDRIQTIWLRAGIIIGSGSASFEIIRNIVQKLPVMTPPMWVKTLTQPIAVDDVLEYLTAAKDLSVEGNLVVDIGSERMSFLEMLEQASDVMGLSRILIPMLLPTLKLSSYWFMMLTPVPTRIASALIEGIRSETVMQNDNARRHFPDIIPMSYEDALRRALREIEENQVISRWSDSSAGEVSDIVDSDIAEAVFIDTQTMDLGEVRAEDVFSTITHLGGHRGWLRYNVLWRIRGAIDKLLGGYGLTRGRRDPEKLRIGDSLDFWKVADLVDGKRLLLVSQMVLPGKAWLEFTVAEGKLTQRSYFYPNGILGRLYWYVTFPFHTPVFRSLADALVESSKRAR
ncbi:MAG: SDR family oxidoreductase [Thermoplasmata archaeon]